MSERKGCAKLSCVGCICRGKSPKCNHCMEDHMNVDNFPRCEKCGEVQHELGYDLQIYRTVAMTQFRLSDGFERMESSLRSTYMEVVVELEKLKIEMKQQEKLRRKEHSNFIKKLMK